MHGCGLKQIHLVANLPQTLKCGSAVVDKMRRWLGFLATKGSGRRNWWHLVEAQLQDPSRLCCLGCSSWSSRVGGARSRSSKSLDSAVSKEQPSQHGVQDAGQMEAAPMSGREEKGDCVRDTDLEMSEGC